MALESRGWEGWVLPGEAQGKLTVVKFLTLLSSGKDVCQAVDHGCEHACVSTGESYVCKCMEGFRLAEDGKRCRSKSLRLGTVRDLLLTLEVFRYSQCHYSKFLPWMLCNCCACDQYTGPSVLQEFLIQGPELSGSSLLSLSPSCSPFPQELYGCAEPSRVPGSPLERIRIWVSNRGEGQSIVVALFILGKPCK